MDADSGYGTHVGPGVAKVTKRITAWSAQSACSGAGVGIGFGIEPQLPSIPTPTPILSNGSTESRPTPRRGRQD